ncbi:MAG: hypothetical protein Fur0037_17760 [Planctomycetota bacterium]
MGDPLLLLLLLLLGLNAAAFGLYGFDKRAARRGDRRVSERALLAVAFLGGWAGAWTAMGFFRHKTRKRSFRWKLAASTVLSPSWVALWLSLPSG